MMKLKKLGLILSVAAAIAVTGCHSSQQLLEPSLSLKQKHQKPEFLDDIALGGNSKTINITAADKIGSRKSINPSLTNVLQAKYADVLRVVPDAITNLSLYNFIEDWYGVRYKMGGGDRSGIDCSAFVQRLYESVFCTNLVRTAFEQFNTCRLVFNQDSLKEGDLVFFKTRGKKRITHVGIYLMNNFFVHASSTQGVTISSLNEAYWSRFYAGAGQILSRQTTF
jgi:cell wall-associated NlpC family hydrolase